MKEVKIPNKLAPLVKAFSADEKGARLLIIEALKAISKAETQGAFDMGAPECSEAEIEGIIALMQGIAPKDTLEMLYGAQIISAHLMGIRLLAHDFPGDQALGLKLLRFSNDALAQLQKKRSGGISQNINITYNNAGQGSALMQTVIPGSALCQ